MTDVALGNLEFGFISQDSSLKIQSSIEEVLWKSLVISVFFETLPGEDLFVTGSSDFLNNWSTEKPLPMSWQSGHEWIISFDRKAVEQTTCLVFKFLFFCQEPKKLIWEADPNHHLDVDVLRKLFRQEEVQNMINLG